MKKSKVVKPGMVFTPRIKRIKLEYSNGVIKVYKRSWKTFWAWKFKYTKTLDYLKFVQKDLKDKFNLTLEDLYVIDINTLEAINKL